MFPSSGVPELLNCFTFDLCVDSFEMVVSVAVPALVTVLVFFLAVAIAFGGAFPFVSFSSHSEVHGDLFACGSGP